VSQRDSVLKLTFSASRADERNRCATTRLEGREFRWERIEFVLSLVRDVTELRQSEGAIT
jgi:hypothetical protein